MSYKVSAVSGVMGNLELFSYLIPPDFSIFLVFTSANFISCFQCKALWSPFGCYRGLNKYFLRYVLIISIIAIFEKIGCVKLDYMYTQSTMPLCIRFISALPAVFDLCALFYGSAGVDKFPTCGTIKSPLILILK